MIHISQQSELWCRIDDGCLKVIGIGAGDGDTDAIACTEQVGGGHEVKHQLDRLACRNQRQIAFVMAVVRQSQIVEWRLTQYAVRRPQVTLGNIG